MFLDVNCLNLSYSSISPEVSEAGRKLEERWRGWSTEEDRKRKALNLRTVLMNTQGWRREDIEEAYDKGPEWICKNLFKNYKLDCIGN